MLLVFKAEVKTALIFFTKQVPMQSQTVKTLGYEIQVQVPSSVEEFDSLAKKQGVCLEQAILNIIYRSVLAKVRTTFVEVLEEQTGIARLTKDSGKKRKNEAGVEEPVLVFTETEGEFVDRVLVETKSSKENFEALMVSVASKVTFDPSETEAKPSGPKKVAQAYLDAAKTIIDKGQGDSVAAKLTSKLGFPVEPTIESLGRAIAEDQRRKKAEIAAEYA
jgi:hypothetical protein